MEIVKNPTILGLSDEEIKIINTLNTDQSPTEIAKNTGVPRTTINYILKELLKKEIIIKIKEGKRYRYRLSEKDKLSKLSDEVRVFFDPSLSVLTVPSFKGLSAHKGIASIVALHKKLMSEEPKHSRVKVIQPNKSFLNMFDNADVEEIIELNKAISDSKIILDAILEEDAYKEYEKYWRVDPENFEKLNPTFLNRTTDYVTVEKNSISFENELWIYFNSVVITNYKEKVAVLITNPETRGLLSSLYDNMKTQGEKIDHGEEILNRQK